MRDIRTDEFIDPVSTKHHDHTDERLDGTQDRGRRAWWKRVGGNPARGTHQLSGQPGPGARGKPSPAPHAGTAQEGDTSVPSTSRLTAMVDLLR